MDKRLQILVAAERVFLKLGYDRASVDILRREAGVSKGTIYTYFDSKEDLFRRLCDEIHDRVFVGLISDQPFRESDREWLARFGVMFTRLMTSDPVIDAARTVIAVVDRMPELSEAFFESGFRKGLVILSEFLAARRAIVGLDTPYGARSLLDLFLSGTHRERLLGLMSEHDAYAQAPAAVERALAIAYRDH